MESFEPLSWDQAQSLLAGAGIPLAPARLTHSMEEALEAAEQLGYPVAVKGISKQQSHKTEGGLVYLNCEDSNTVRQSIEAMRAKLLGVPLEGFLIQKMIQGGVEMIVGIHRDPQFGAVLLAGGGGTLVELFNDTALRLAPVTKTQAEEMLQETLSWKLLQGFRGKARANLSALADLMVNVSQLAAAPQSNLVGLDLNPVMVLPEGAWVVDFRIYSGPDSTSIKQEVEE